MRPGLRFRPLPGPVLGGGGSTVSSQSWISRPKLHIPCDPVSPCRVAVSMLPGSWGSVGHPGSPRGREHRDRRHTYPFPTSVWCAHVLLIATSQLPAHLREFVLQPWIEGTDNFPGEDYVACSWSDVWITVYFLVVIIMWCLPVYHWWMLMSAEFSFIVLNWSDWCFCSGEDSNYLSIPQSRVKRLNGWIWSLLHTYF